MLFGEALNYLREGKRLARYGWHASTQYIELQVPDELSKTTQPYILFGNTTEPLRVPWVASQTDLLSDDWFIREDEK